MSDHYSDRKHIDGNWTREGDGGDGADDGFFWGRGFRKDFWNLWLERLLTVESIMRC